MLKQLLLVPALATVLLTSCNHRKCGDPRPRASCVQGTVVGKTCYDGVLIQVSGSSQIGRPWGGSNNVIATDTNLNGLDAQGQTVYFNYRPETPADRVSRPCPAVGVPANVPRFVLTDASATACNSVAN